MDIFKNPSFDFLKMKKVYYGIAIAVIIIGIIAIVINGGLKYHIDFTGGLSLEVSPIVGTAPASPETELVIIDEEFVFTEDEVEEVVIAEEPANFELAKVLSVNEIREALSKHGIDAEIQEITRNYSFLIKARSDGQGGNNVLVALETEYPAQFPRDRHYVISQDDVGPRAGADLRSQAIKAVLISLLFMLIYIWVRFRFTWGFACVLALVHDTVVTLGILSVFQKEIGMTILAGLLTIIGYSINNTIVIFDRIREDLKLYRKDTEYQVINRAVNETLNRNMLMSLTTLLAVVSLLVFGGSVIYDFAFTLFIGVIAGTFSSICIVPGLIHDIVLAVSTGKKKK